MKFRLLVGTHISKKHVYQPNDIVDAEEDLVIRFGKNKFGYLAAHEIVEANKMEDYQPVSDTKLKTVNIRDKVK